MVTSKEAVSLFSGANKAYWYVVSGGEGKRDLSTFTKGDLEYRYMAENLDSEEKLRAYLENWYTPEQTANLFKELGFITHNGKLAQPNADGGSLLNWEKASVIRTTGSTTVKTYELKVPLGELNEVETVMGELRYVPGQGWKVHSLGN
ncbi:DL-endopeptidase inhibitor IseA family protein [Lysinibacillus sp. BW-2-10]|uniref:DL-endopeptidase inhibitor IseA family protein n=1 Tax=Lysinibacillus sp. BW-2-10 TaxID=2590030 RepID=UPI001181425E|nr:DL-endopeptidase inhibitor IseA family protein [Lysinibacillus sp. BW-2-10]TSI03987.1 hypothetical protein FJQ64_15315 [Lysinibacillus sp. BW-2-10]